ncbi:uncharacterized protein PFL1_05897 [Pseudozyma flocculosa PF-1]|uniref:Uncharacterized protein n=1 Tax=Pseudozyma flocculosa PF-1 TaxID=1277687 RepID=A0A061H7M0_9BASI|nr:uncharacterized protein PFL1_05897 [Pseudozyma flocculosa PF-1]EPQ26576.1 hypothetical protein PFL1_05897 [Pseudozyma flocculosa PF-1]
MVQANFGDIKGLKPEPFWQRSGWEASLPALRKEPTPAKGSKAGASANLRASATTSPMGLHNHSILQAPRHAGSPSHPPPSQQQQQQHDEYGGVATHQHRHHHHRHHRHRHGSKPPTVPPQDAPKRESGREASRPRQEFLSAVTANGNAFRYATAH